MSLQISLEQIAAYHQRGRELLLEQINALEAIIHNLHLLDPKKQSPSIWMPALMLQSVGVSIHSVLALTRERDMAIRDGFGIARSAVETALNAAFIAISGDALAEQAVRHMRQKRWRDLRRQANIGGLKITASRDVGLQEDDLPGLREALNEFTSKRGREITSWTQTSVEERIGFVTEKSRRAGIALGSAIFGIYRPASELLHGSYYGVNYFWQGSRETPVQDRKEFDTLWLLEHFVLLLSTVFLGACGAIDALAVTHKLHDHANRQDRLSHQLQILIETIGLEDPDDEHDFHAEQST